MILPTCYSPLGRGGLVSGCSWHSPTSSRAIGRPPRGLTGVSMHKEGDKTNEEIHGKLYPERKKQGGLRNVLLSIAVAISVAYPSSGRAASVASASPTQEKTTLWGGLARWIPPSSALPLQFSTNCHICRATRHFLTRGRMPDIASLSNSWA